MTIVTSQKTLDTICKHLLIIAKQATKANLFHISKIMYLTPPWTQSQQPGAVSMFDQCSAGQDLNLIVRQLNVNSISSTQACPLI